MTYLEVVNSVLKRLRERTVATVEESTYSSLIGVLVNDALRDVENAWSWSGLRTTLTATTEADVFNYELNGSQNNLTVLDVINDSDNFFLKEKDAHTFNSYFLTSTPQTGSPTSTPLTVSVLMVIRRLTCFQSQIKHTQLTLT